MFVPHRSVDPRLIQHPPIDELTSRVFELRFGHNSEHSIWGVVSWPILGGFVPSQPLYARSLGTMPNFFAGMPSLTETQTHKLTKHKPLRTRGLA